MIIDCVGCLHGFMPELEGGDLLIVTGDVTAHDRSHQYLEFFHWLLKQNYKKKIIIAGNHDTKIQQEGFFFNDDSSCQYLCDSGTEFEGLKIWGSPWIQRFVGINPKCTAFTKLTEDSLMDEWERIPKGTDILVTHTPPYGILDCIPPKNNSSFHMGSKALYNWLKYVERPRLHVFSHVHEGYGQTEYFDTYDDKMMISVNCSIMNEHYQPVNDPIRIIL